MSVVDIAKTAPEADEESGAAGGGKKKLLLVILVLALAGGAAYWFLLRPSGTAEAAPEPGAVVKLDAIQVNLADDHYLKVGIALQASKDAGEELDGSKALDQTIDLFSGQSMEDLSRRAFRDKLKQSLEHRLDEAYEGEVIGVYFTDFVSQ
jgi:flagellar FliL protein